MPSQLALLPTEDSFSFLSSHHFRRSDLKTVLDSSRATLLHDPFGWVAEVVQHKFMADALMAMPMVASRAAAARVLWSVLHQQARIRVQIHSPPQSASVSPSGGSVQNARCYGGALSRVVHVNSRRQERPMAVFASIDLAQCQCRYTPHRNAATVAAPPRWGRPSTPTRQTAQGWMPAPRRTAALREAPSRSWGHCPPHGLSRRQMRACPVGHST
mmetsp:Transcript_2309/g.6470  ORF Transcript_2309/g.6470 Transcript_2309/m.6470 type:complete len:215 (-) Transcript_2309:234-878(-)